MKGASKADQLKALETIVADGLKKSIHFTRREVEREVIVATGRYQFHPLGGLPNERAVHLGTESLPSEDGGGGGSGSLAKMLDWLGNRIGRLVIDETESSNERVQWRDHLARSMNEIASDTEAGRDAAQTPAGERVEADVADAPPGAAKSDGVVDFRELKKSSRASRRRHPRTPIPDNLSTPISAEGNPALYRLQHRRPPCRTGIGSVKQLNPPNMAACKPDLQKLAY